MAAVFFVFMVVFFILTTIGNIRSIMRQFKGTSRHSSSNSGQSAHWESTQTKETVYESNSPRKGKIIPHDEGEYVDYEEVK